MLPVILEIRDEEDRSFVEQVYEQNKHKLYLIAYDILENHHDAEDCVNDVIVAIIDHLQRYQAADEDHKRNMLARICRNIAIDKYRRRYRRYKHDVYVDSMPNYEIVDNSAYVDELFEKQENRRKLREAMEKIDDSYSDILFHFYWLGMSTAEIAKMLGISDGNARMRLTRARRAVLENWEDTLYENRK